MNNKKKLNGITFQITSVGAPIEFLSLKLSKFFRLYSLMALWVQATKLKATNSYF